MAVANYHETYKCYPPPFIADADGKPLHSWRILVLPFLERNDLYKQYRFDEPWDGPSNRKIADQMPSIYALHGIEKPGNITTNYLRVVGDQTASPPNRLLDMTAITDGVSSTLFVVENVGANVHWMEPRDLMFDSMSLTINNPNGISSWLEPPAGLMLDFTVKTIRTNTPAEVVRALLTNDGGEDVAWKYFDEITDGRLRLVTSPIEDGDGRRKMEGEK